VPQQREHVSAASLCHVCNDRWSATDSGVSCGRQQILPDASQAREQGVVVVLSPRLLLLLLLGPRGIRAGAARSYLGGQWSQHEARRGRSALECGGARDPRAWRTAVAQYVGSGGALLQGREATSGRHSRRGGPRPAPPPVLVRHHYCGGQRARGRRLSGGWGPGSSASGPASVCLAVVPFSTAAEALRLLLLLLHRNSNELAPHL
jgi:hypothetical protein